MKPEENCASCMAGMYIDNSDINNPFCNDCDEKC